MNSEKAETDWWWQKYFFWDEIAY